MELDLYTREIPYDRRWFVKKVIFFILENYSTRDTDILTVFFFFISESQLVGP